MAMLAAAKVAATEDAGSGITEAPSMGISGKRLRWLRNPVDRYRAEIQNLDHRRRSYK